LTMKTGTALKPDGKGKHKDKEPGENSEICGVTLLRRFEHSKEQWEICNPQGLGDPGFFGKTRKVLGPIAEACPLNHRLLVLVRKREVRDCYEDYFLIESGWGLKPKKKERSELIWHETGKGGGFQQTGERKRGQTWFLIFARKKTPDPGYP